MHRQQDVDLKIYHADISDFSRSGCTVVTNPPYAQRLGQKEQVHASSTVTMGNCTG